MKASTGAVVFGLALAVLGAPAWGDRAADFERLRDAIERARDRVAHYEREERGLLEAIEALERSASLLEREVGLAQRRADEARTALERLEVGARDLEARLARTEAAMADRAVALYRAGELGTLRMLFASEGLPEFLSRVAALRSLLRHDATLLARHLLESRALEGARADAREAAEESREARALLTERSSELSRERATKRRLATRLRERRGLERKALAELETAGRALESTVAELRAARDGVPSGPAFSSLRGRLESPVKAPVASGFGRVVDPEFQTETLRKGIVYAAPLRTPVHAVAAGRVRFAGRFRGYGNLVILDHGEDYFSVLGHLARIDVEVGDAIRARQRVALSGETGSLEGPKLYFEIRRGGTALDPARWLAAGPLGTAAARR